MADDTTSRPTTLPGLSLRRAMTSSADARPRPRLHSAGSFEAPAPGIRRRSSNFSDYSIRSFQSSTDDLLLPRPRGAGVEGEGEGEGSSAWHSAPLAFALLPAVGGVLFTNGSAVITDVMLLGLAAIFLNWSVRLPWDWYRSAQAIRVEDEGAAVVDGDSEDESALSMSSTTLPEVPEDAPAPEPTPKPRRRRPAREAATKELYRHELLALLSCFVLPVCGAYLLHTLRSQLSRPSEGLVSNYNLTIFILASELRPMSHLVKLVQSRTLYLQRIVHANPYEGRERPADIKGLVQRLEGLEARVSGVSPGNTAELSPGGKPPTLTAEVRRDLQPDIDALTRAVRRYEKRATLLAFQTESKLLDLESRLNDAVSLAAAAESKSSESAISRWSAAVIAAPLQILGVLAGLPLRMAMAVINLGRTSVVKQPPGKEAARPRRSGERSVGGKK